MQPIRQLSSPRHEPHRATALFLHLVHYGLGVSVGTPAGRQNVLAGGDARPPVHLLHASQKLVYAHARALAQVHARP